LAGISFGEDALDPDGEQLTNRIMPVIKTRLTQIIEIINGERWIFLLMRVEDARIVPKQIDAALLKNPSNVG
jgi:hypothetical protein